MNVSRVLLLASILSVVPCRAEEPGAKGPSPAPPAAAASKVPRVVVESESLDIGSVPRGQTATATFVLRNTGDEVLKILGAKPG